MAGIHAIDVIPLEILIDELHDLCDQVGTREYLTSIDELLLLLGSTFARWTEQLAVRYVRTTLDTSNEEVVEEYSLMASEADQLTYSMNVVFESLSQHPNYQEWVRHPRNELFVRKLTSNRITNKKSNRARLVEEQRLQQLYLSKAADATSYSTDRLSKNQVNTVDAYLNNNSKWENVSGDIDVVFTRMLTERTRIAEQCGFVNYVDFSFEAKHRFEYDVHDCGKMHEALRDSIIPLLEEIDKRRLINTNSKQLKPWDVPLDSNKELLLERIGGFQTSKLVAIFDGIDSEFGEIIRRLDADSLLNLQIQHSKRPTPFNQPLIDSATSYVQANGLTTVADLITLVHECGHAVHSVLSGRCKRQHDRVCSEEVSELFSLTFEFIAIEHLDKHFSLKVEQSKSIKAAFLESRLRALLWISKIDLFQQWAYGKPNHSVADRHSKWLALENQYSSSLEDWSGLESLRSKRWQSQRHIFIAPLYYVEYAFGLLGAIGIWGDYLRNPVDSIRRLKSAMSMGSADSDSQVYGTAGVPFCPTESEIMNVAKAVRDGLEL